MKRKTERFLALMLAAVMAFSLAACGKDGNEDANTPVDDGGEYVYVPSFEDLNPEENGWFENMSIQDGAMYYLSNSYDEEKGISINSICKKELTEGAEPQILYSLEPDTTEEGGYQNLQNFVLLPEGKLALLFQSWSPESEQNSWFLKIVDADGTEIFAEDITQAVTQDTDYAYINAVITDEEGNIFLQSEDRILVYDGTGKFLFRLDSKENWIHGIGNAKDGTVLVLQYAGGNMDLSPIDVAKKGYGVSYQGIPTEINGGNGSGVLPGLEKDLLIRTNSGLVEYDMESQSYEEVLTWLDCDINPDYVEAIAITPDGKIMVLIREWSMENTMYQLCTLTKTLKSEVPQKKIITLGTMGLSQGIQNEIVNFNKTSSEYRIQVIDYTKDLDWNVENAYQDAMKKFNNDIMTGNAADIIDLSIGSYEQYMNKGIIEDLTPYLENSTVISRDDLNAAVLNAYTVDGKLPCIPSNFMIQTMVAKKSDVGDKTGWTMADLIALADSKPADTMILRYGIKNDMLSTCLRMDEASYIDWSTGKCNFDSEEFKTVLEFANRFPNEYDYEQEMDSEAKLIGEGKLLLMPYVVSEFTDIQWITAMYQGDSTFIGYPTADGSNGSVFIGEDTLGINAKSENKEGAWKFLEGLLTEKYQTGMFSHGLPTLNSVYDKKLAEAMEKNWELDENGEKVLDENGNPIEASTGGMGFDDFFVDFYAVTQEEADQLAALIAGTDTVGNYNNASEVYTIIEEEAAPYFAGQKTLDEVVQIIQSRVSIYISENM